MAHSLTQRILVHDLLEIDSKHFLASANSGDVRPPEWGIACLQATPFVHVRRGVENEEVIPIGVRGASRSQRWATVCHRRLVRSVTKPQQLLALTVSSSRALSIPALQSLQHLKVLWAALELPWGPAGSIGFEMLTQRDVSTPESDLDVVVCARRRIAKEKAGHLCHLATGLPAKVDIRVETGGCGFSLDEYASARAKKLLLRTAHGEFLGHDPWDI